MRRPLRTAIAVIVATAMLTPTIASAAPVVPDAPSPVPGVESSSPYADDGVTYTADGRPLYESVSDTIYIYNALQTAVARQDDAADQPVLTGDGDAETFGTGQPIYAEGSDEPLTYSPEHTYVYVGGTGNTSASDSGDAEPSGEQNSADKNDQAEKNEQVEKNDEADKNVDQETEQDDKDTEETTAAEDAAAIEGAEVLSDGEDGDTGKVLLADENAVSNGIDGRDYEGQISIDINGTTYILIGNEQQLRAIGTGAQAHGPVYSYKPGVLGLTEDSDFKPYYPGDADLKVDEELHSDEFKKNGGAGSGLEGGIEYTGRRFCGVDANGVHDSSVDSNPELYYTASANYIIFRDIDLSKKVAGEPEDGLWTPIMFSGIMLGANSMGMNKGALPSLVESASAVKADTIAPTISTVTVHQTGKLDSRAYSGIGFFGTISNKLNTEETSKGFANIGVSGGTATVTNLHLSKVSVTNESVRTESTETLVSGLVGLVGGILGGLLGGLLGILGGTVDAILGTNVSGLA